MKIGDLVDIHFYDEHMLSNLYTGFGMIVGINGYKIDVLRNGQVEVWDRHDLEKMARWKKEDDLKRATRKTT